MQVQVSVASRIQTGPGQFGQERHANGRGPLNRQHPFGKPWQRTQIYDTSSTGRTKPGIIRYRDSLRQIDGSSVERLDVHPIRVCPTGKGRHAGQVNHAANPIGAYRGVVTRTGVIGERWQRNLGTAGCVQVRRIDDSRPKGRKRCGGTADRQGSLGAQRKTVRNGQRTAGDGQMFRTFQAIHHRHTRGMCDRDVPGNIDDDIVRRIRQGVGAPVRCVVPVGGTGAAVPRHGRLADLCSYRADVAVQVVVVPRPGEKGVSADGHTGSRRLNTPAVGPIGVGLQQNVAEDSECAVAIGVPIELNGFDGSVRIGNAVGGQRQIGALSDRVGS